MVGKAEYTLLHILSDVLSIITISSCLILKVPQIITLLKVKNTHGINILGLLMELCSYSIMFSYNFQNGYALLTYMEYPIILVQQIVLIAIVIYYNRYPGMYSLVGFSSYFAILATFLMGSSVRHILAFLVPLCTPIGCSSKVVQLFEILRSKNSDSVSVLTWFISAFTNFTRVFTIWMDSADFSLLLNFIVNVFLSSSVMCAAYYYKQKDTKHIKE